MISDNVPNNKKRNKIILIIVITIIMFCLIICGVGFWQLRKVAEGFVQLDPQKAKELTTQITDYDLPAGYKEMGGTSSFGIITAAISDEKNPNNTIWLMQVTSEGSIDPENFLKNAIAYETNNPITWTPVDIKLYTIRSEKSSVSIYDGIAQDGKKYHAWAAKFTGKGGKAVIIIVSPSETWSDEIADAFIKSLR